MVEDVGNDEARQSEVRGGGLGAIRELGDESVGGSDDADAQCLADGQLSPARSMGSDSVTPRTRKRVTTSQ